MKMLNEYNTTLRANVRTARHRMRILLALAWCALFALALRAEASPLVSVGSATHRVGDTFTIAVSISGVTNLQAFQFDLAYDDTVLSVLGYTDAGTDFEAAATTGAGVLTGITGFAFAGLLSGVADSMSGASSGLTGIGVLVNIEFEAIGVGTSALTLSGVFLDFSDSGFDVAAGSVCVVRPTESDCASVPAPGTLALLALGLPFLAGRVLTRARNELSSGTRRQRVKVIFNQTVWRT